MTPVSSTAGGKETWGPLQMDVSSKDFRDLPSIGSFFLFKKFLRFSQFMSATFVPMACQHDAAAATAAKSLQSCPTLCDPIDSSPLGSSVPGILQARILEWVAISFSTV